DGDAATVVPDGDRVVLVDLHLDAVAVARERLVHGVVHDLVDEVVEAAHADVADVHRGALADGFEPFENLDVVGFVLARRPDRHEDLLVPAVQARGYVCHISPECGVRRGNGRAGFPPSRSENTAFCDPMWYAAGPIQFGRTSSFANPSKRAAERSSHAV